MDDATPSPAEADAAHAMAIKAAEGDGVPADWTAALDHLRHAAALGSALAHAELAALSGEWPTAQAILAGEAVPRSRWSGPSGTIDPATWLPSPRKAELSATPRISLVEGIATAEICAWLIARARPRLKPARIYDDKEGQHRTSGGRSNTVCPFPAPERDLVLAIVRARIAEVTGLPVRAMESPHILHYSVGEEFRPHFDTPEDPNAPGFRQRVLTFLLSLNDDYEGGETEFPAIGGRWKGRRGAALFFWNVGADGRLDRATLHAGRPVTRGEKWMLSQWVGPAGEA